MQIPGEYDEFESKTLILVLAHFKGRVFLAEGSKFEELDPLTTPETDYTYSDKEGFSMVKGSGSRGTIPGNEEKNKRHYEKIFLNFIADKLKNLHKNYEFEELAILLPSSIKKKKKKKVPTHILEKTRILIGNFINASEMDIFKKIVND